MNVYVHAAGVHFQEQEVRWCDAFRDKVLIGLHHGLVEVGAAEISAVNKEELVPQGLFGTFRLAHESAQVADGGFRVNVHDFSHHAGAQEVLDAEFERPSRFHHVDIPSVMGKGESYVRPCYCHTLEFFHNVAEFYGVALEEFTACGYVVEEVANREVAARRGLDFFCSGVLGAGHGYFHTGFVFLAAGPEGYFRNCGN